MTTEYTGTMITDLLAIVHAKIEIFMPDGPSDGKEEVLSTVQRALEMAHAKGKFDAVQQLAKDLVQR